jgi:ribosomal protein S18 acetylase RimI-like enzyme
MRNFKFDFFKLFPDFSYTNFQLQISAQCHGEDNWSHQVFYEQMYGDEYRGGIYARVKDGDYAGILVWTLMPNKRQVDISNVGVATAYRQLGIAKLLFEVFLNAVYQRKLFTSAILHVAVSNFPALSLYTKFGFEIREEIPEYYNPGNAYKMKAYIVDKWPYSREVLEEKVADAFSMKKLEHSLNEIEREENNMKIESETIEYGDDTSMRKVDEEVAQNDEVLADPLLKIKPITFHLPW